MPSLRPKILFSTPQIHHPAIGGPFLRIENSIKALSRVSDLFIYSRVPISRMGGSSAVSFYSKHCNDFLLSPSARYHDSFFGLFKRGLNLLSRKLTDTNLFFLSSETERDYAHLLKVASLLEIDVIWLGYGNISYPLLKYIKCNSNYKVVLDTDSVWSRFLLRGLPYAKSKPEYLKVEAEGKSKEEEERWGTKLADITTAVSETDAAYYRQLATATDRVKIFSNVIDIDKYSLELTSKPDEIRHPSIYLAGTFGPGSPMDDAARWVINQVLPLIRRRIPNIHFYIIGNGSDITLSDIQDSQITIAGKLDSVLPYLCHVNVALVSLRFESGTRFKILEAGACKVPVVSTTLGAEGIPVTHGHNILIADQPEEFARAVIKVIEDPSFARQMSDSLYSLIREKYSVDSLVHEGAKIIEYLYS
jgi:glycosyltransferase involved in cell wall biosynthesis